MIDQYHKLSMRFESRTRIYRPSLLAVAAMMAVGCNQSPFDADVVGTVKIDGKPVGPGSIFFSPVAGGDSGRGDVGPDGKFFLITRHERGIPSGEYTVAVQMSDKGAPPAPGARSSAPLKPLVPERYFDTTTSGLQFTVEPGSNTINIELSSDEGKK